MQIEFRNSLILLSLCTVHNSVFTCIFFFCRKWCETRGTTTSWLRISWRKNASSFIFHHMWHFCRNLIVQCHNNPSLLLFSFPIMSLRKRYTEERFFLNSHTASALPIQKVSHKRMLSHQDVASSIWNCCRSWNDTRVDVYHRNDFVLPT